MRAVLVSTSHTEVRRLDGPSTRPRAALGPRPQEVMLAGSAGSGSAGGGGCGHRVSGTGPDDAPDWMSVPRRLPVGQSDPSPLPLLCPDTAPR